MNNEDDALVWGAGSPLAVATDQVTLPEVAREGRVRYLLVSGPRTNGAWGLIGAFWVSLDRERGGFLVSPQAIWTGSEMVRSYRQALRRGWDHDRIYRYWKSQVGVVSRSYSIEAERSSQRLLSLQDFLSEA